MTEKKPKWAERAGSESGWGLANWLTWQPRNRGGVEPICAASDCCMFSYEIGFAVPRAVFGAGALKSWT